MYSLFALLVLVASASAASVGNRIIGGTPTTIQEHPYQVSIQQAGVHVCGGVLVRPNKVLTTAACATKIVRPNFPITVKLGTADRTMGGNSVVVTSVAVHPEFKLNIFDCDVAVLTLQLPQARTATVSSIELVGVGRKPTVGSIMTVTGWGYKQVGLNELSRYLEIIRLPVLGNVQCEAIYRPKARVVLDRAFCIGDGSSGPTEGDSGDPVVNVNRQLAGIVSWGKLGGMPGYPTVVTDFSHAVVRRFIDDSTQ